MIRASTFALLGAVFLQACGVPEPDTPPADTTELLDAFYRHDGPPKLTLMTMVNNRTGSGAHTSLMINASQRVIWDPAGTLRLSAVPHRDDVWYGVTPVVEDFYMRAHARETFSVIIQELEVSPEVAEMALQLAQTSGPVAAARCAASTSALLQQLAGFGSINGTWFPNNLRDQFAQLSGVETRQLFENDADDKGLAVTAFERRLSAEGAL